jgi:hypothetical protein
MDMKSMTKKNVSVTLDAHKKPSEDVAMPTKTYKLMKSYLHLVSDDVRHIKV